MSLAKAKGPIDDLGLQPYNSPLKLRFFPLIQGEKWGFEFWKLILFNFLIYMREGAVSRAP